ncbi:MAG TPA: hypothetical protein VGM75_16510 [Pseudonocardiaceae bacterium]
MAAPVAETDTAFARAPCRAGSSMANGRIVSATTPQQLAPWTRLGGNLVP